MPMTNAQFSILASRMASRASSWAADCLDLKEYRERPIRQGDVDRFIKSQRDLLDYIEQETRQPVTNGEHQ
jgi:hypothetical protein